MTDSRVAIAAAPTRAPTTVPTLKPAWKRGRSARPVDCSMAAPWTLTATSHVPIAKPNSTRQTTIMLRLTR